MTEFPLGHPCYVFKARYGQIWIFMNVGQLNLAPRKIKKVLKTKRYGQTHTSQRFRFSGKHLSFHYIDIVNRLLASSMLDAIRAHSTFLSSHLKNFF